jgi:hypothetical protein
MPSSLSSVDFSSVTDRENHGESRSAPRDRIRPAPYHPGALITLLFSHRCTSPDKLGCHT